MKTHGTMTGSIVGKFLHKPVDEIGRQDFLWLARRRGYDWFVDSRHGRLLLRVCLNRIGDDLNRAELAQLAAALHRLSVGQLASAQSLYDIAVLANTIGRMLYRRDGDQCSPDSIQAYVAKDTAIACLISEYAAEITLSDDPKFPHLQVLRLRPPLLSSGVHVYRLTAEYHRRRLPKPAPSR